MSNQLPSSAEVARSKYIALTPWSAKLLSVVALGGMYSWFILKFFLAEDRPALMVLVGCLALAGIIASMTLFVCTYSYVANAPERYIDERELSQRNAAYFRAYQYAVVVLLLGSVGNEVAEKIGYEISAGIFGNYLLLCFTTFLIFPTTILVWTTDTVSE